MTVTPLATFMDGWFVPTWTRFCSATTLLEEDANGVVVENARGANLEVRGRTARRPARFTACRTTLRNMLIERLASRQISQVSLLEIVSYRLSVLSEEEFSQKENLFKQKVNNVQSKIEKIRRL